MIAFDHVQLAMPPRGESCARAFFVGVLGLMELPKPADLAAHGGCWFGHDAMQLHLGVDYDFRPARRAHVAFVVSNLAEIAARLVEAGAPVDPVGAINGRARFNSADPFGNRLEFIATA